MSVMKSKLLDITTFEASTCSDINRFVGSGGLTIVFSNNGKRASMNDATLGKFPHQDSVQFAYSDDVIAIANYIGETNTDYKLNKSGKNGVIYNASLVKEIVDRYHLDFSNRTSLTFPIMDIQEAEDGTIVYVNMNPTKTVIED